MSPRELLNKMCDELEAFEKIYPSQSNPEICGATIILSPDGCKMTQDGEWHGYCWRRIHPIGQGKVIIDITAGG